MDESFRARFATVPDVLEGWLGSDRLKGASILDFGCGEGVSALSLALRYPASRVVGVDIMSDPERCLSVASAQIGLGELPPNLRLHRVDPGTLHSSEDRFDVVYSWSVFEHVDQRLLAKTLELIRSSLGRNGLFFAQIAPLFYSSEGSHLFHRVDAPWGHLLMQDSVLRERLESAVADVDERRALWSTYSTLNRVTAPEMLERMEQAGFEIMRRYTTRDPRSPDARLTGIYQEDVLTTNQVVALARAAPGNAADAGAGGPVARTGPPAGPPFAILLKRWAAGIRRLAGRVRTDREQ